ncbi:hypothetical protein SERLADRAFT_451376 [Serpula lacrymans var. lacrymans S7.9]|uniref:Uncharacterized protein n=1 Tax=Serpula lacrymans var. lacrymans (strain S7.9) TaxID=578457 RepID=F8P306_SERL9|nr:uncharacterized protein SERLADRAFT_451376 [Serpula lacrymans var. lacrymans S7.9]EGO22537.1 hypothetical protein SERLADRAFT_451376 [Serpula lacrymans var. lacrymans S7.9]
MPLDLPATIKPGIVNFPGRTPETQETVQRLLADDRRENHCFFVASGLHNHLSHHLLAAYDLGASTKLLQDIYNEENKSQRPILSGSANDSIDEHQPQINRDNFEHYLGKQKYYSAFLSFFTAEIATHGVPDTLEALVFNPSVNKAESNMLSRFLAGAFHPFIQTGYGAEFDSDAMIAQEDTIPKGGLPLLCILRQVYDSNILKPVMPYDPNALLSSRRKALMKDGRPEEIKRICRLWWKSTSAEDEVELGNKVEEFFWMSTLLLAATGKEGRKPRLDFFLMHVLNATIFLPSLLKIIPTKASRIKLLKGLLPVVVMYVLMRGRPRINPELLLSYTAVPRPPNFDEYMLQKPSASAIGGPCGTESYLNPWHGILVSVVHAPDAHTLKAIRTLYYAAQHYGHKAPGQVLGSSYNGKETHVGVEKLDGTVFVRAAGVIMDTLGWVSHGEGAGKWDYSGLGWEDAWKE